MPHGLNAVVLAFVVAICANAAETADNVAAKVFTPEIAQKVLGGPVEPAKRNSQADISNGSTVVSQCSYALRTDSDQSTSTSLVLRRAGSSEEAKKIFLASKQMYKGEDVASLGEAAYRTAAPAQLNVLQGKTWLIISAGVFPKPDPALQEKAAREILKNIHD